MSQPFCPDCRLLDMPYSSSCNLCGWEGKPRPRKKFYPEDLRERQEKTRAWKKLKSEGKLHFVRIYIDGNDEQIKQTTEMIRDFVKAHNLGWHVMKHYERMNMYRVQGPKPEKDVLKKLSDINGVEQIIVY